MTGIERIAAERQRQIEQEGWTPEHDDKHGDGSLACAAACYALPPTSRRLRVPPLDWPSSWSASWWKPTPEDRERELTKAGALIAAEIDRLLRVRRAALVTAPVPVKPVKWSALNVTTSQGEWVAEWWIRQHWDEHRADRYVPVAGCELCSHDVFSFRAAVGQSFTRLGPTPPGEGDTR